MSGNSELPWIQEYMYTCTNIHAYRDTSASIQVYLYNIQDTYICMHVHAHVPVYMYICTVTYLYKLKCICITARIVSIHIFKYTYVYKVSFVFF